MPTSGGMGEVWRARDTRLDRDVAIEVLPEHFADDQERLRRFEREAKTLASMNHPNVAGIHGIEQVGDTCFLAMELVPGEDLATRLERGPLPASEAIDVGRQIAEGLEAAHEAGVVHRDLKPANLRITPEGVVKILDFGLAKPTRPKVGDGGTTTAESDIFLLTEEGLVLGTPTYMSPEQARGKAVDRRADVWAFGCVLYECLTGKRAFGGETVSDVLAKIPVSGPVSTGREFESASGPGTASIVAAERAERGEGGWTSSSTTRLIRSWIDFWLTVPPPALGVPREKKERRGRIREGSGRTCRTPRGCPTNEALLARVERFEALTGEPAR